MERGEPGARPSRTARSTTAATTRFPRCSSVRTAAPWPPATTSGTVQLWNVANPANAVTLGAPLATGGSQGSSPVNSVTFSPNGKLLASGDDDGVVGMWNVADPAHPQQDGQPLTGHTSFVNAVAFSPDGKTLATGGNDETIRLWNLSVGAAIAHVCSQSSDDITASQWAAYIKLPYRPRARDRNVQGWTLS